MSPGDFRDTSPGTDSVKVRGPGKVSDERGGPSKRWKRVIEWNGDGQYPPNIEEIRK